MLIIWAQFILRYKSFPTIHAFMVTYANLRKLLSVCPSAATFRAIYSVANRNFAKPRRIYLSNRSVRSKPIEIRVIDFAKPRRTCFSLFFVVKTVSKVAQFRGLAAVLATLAI